MKQPKILAVYLPQFYQTPDNDCWWGVGFTDWETVKTAMPYFDDHVQPRIPLQGNYYDLSRREAILQQARIAKEYGIDGFCLYHYYFENGKRELDLPEKIILENKDIKISYCLNWASESWIRSWSRIQGNVWTDRYDDSGSSDTDGVLVLQDYGNEMLWEKHFYELLPHFCDSRYICIDGKPVFVFYSPNDIPCLDAMVSCWRNLAVENGLKGLYLIGTRMKGENQTLDASLVYEPRNSINSINNSGKAEVRNGVRCYDYKLFWDEVLSSPATYNMKTYFSGTVDYDDTPRRGEKGECFINVSPEVFRNGISNLIAKSLAYGNDLIFINAWNEWGEGMHLEADEDRGFYMLQAVKEARNMIDSATVDKYIKQKDFNDKRAIDAVTYDARKFKKLFEIIDRWFFEIQDGKGSLKKYLDKSGYKSFAVYGMSSLGKHLVIQAKSEGLIPLFAIDRYVGKFGDDFKIIRPEENYPKVDCIIVTAYDFAQIKLDLRDKTDAEVVYIGDIINQTYKL